MSSVNSFIKENIREIGSNVYVMPNIPEKLLNNAIKAFKCEDLKDSILAIYDDILFGGGTEGLVFTSEKMIHHKYGEFLYSDIDSVEHIQNILLDEIGNKRIDEYILIKTKNAQNYKLEDGLRTIKIELFTEFLTKIVSEIKDFKESNQSKTISEMSEQLRIAYLKIIINMTFVDDEKIDEKELSELFLLMTRFKLDQETRFKIRVYITELTKNNMETIESLLRTIKYNSKIYDHKSLITSLVKDLINVYFSSKLTKNKNFQFLNNNKKFFNLSYDQLSLAYDIVEIEDMIINENSEDKLIEKKIELAISKTLSLGLSPDILLLSKQVVNLSSKDFTSKLIESLPYSSILRATLLIVNRKNDRYKERELFLRSIIKQNQNTISFLIEDINFIIEKLNIISINQLDIQEYNEKVIKKATELNIENKRLIKIMKSFNGSMSIIDNNTQKYQKAANRLLCPKILDDAKLKSLTIEPDRKSFFNLIKSYYKEENNQFILKENIDVEKLEEIENILKNIGYFDIDKSSNTSDSGIIGKLRGIIS